MASNRKEVSQKILELSKFLVAAFDEFNKGENSKVQLLQKKMQADLAHFLAGKSYGEDYQKKLKKLQELAELDNSLANGNTPNFDKFKEQEKVTQGLEEFNKIVRQYQRTFEAAPALRAVSEKISPIQHSLSAGKLEPGAFDSFARQFESLLEELRKTTIVQFLIDILGNLIPGSEDKKPKQRYDSLLNISRQELGKLKRMEEADQKNEIEKIGKAFSKVPVRQIGDGADSNFPELGLDSDSEDKKSIEERNLERERVGERQEGRLESERERDREERRSERERERKREEQGRELKERESKVQGDNSSDTQLERDLEKLESDTIADLQKFEQNLRDLKRENAALKRSNAELDRSNKELQQPRGVPLPNRVANPIEEESFSNLQAENDRLRQGVEDLQNEKDELEAADNDRIDQLESEISRKDDQIFYLQNKLEELDEEELEQEENQPEKETKQEKDIQLKSEQLQSELKKSSEDPVKLRHELDATYFRLDGANQALLEYTDQIEELGFQIEDLQTNFKKEKNKLLKAIETLTKQRDDLAEQNIALGESLREVPEQKVLSEKALSKLQDELNRKNQGIEEMQRDKAKSDRLAHDLNLKLQETLRKMKDLEKDLQKLEKQRDQARNEALDLKHKDANTKSDIFGLKSKVNGLQAELKAAEELAAKKKADIEDRIKHEQSHLAEIARLEKAIKDGNRDRHEDREAAYRKIDTLQEHLNLEAKSREEDLHNHNDIVAELRREAEDLRDQAIEAEEENESLRDQLSKERVESNRLQNELDGSTERERELQHDLDLSTASEKELNDELNSIQNELRGVQEERNALQSDNQRLEGLWNGELKKRNELERERRDLLQNNHSLENEINGLRQDNDGLRSKNLELQSQIESLNADNDNLKLGFRKLEDDFRKRFAEAERSFNEQMRKMSDAFQKDYDSLVSKLREQDARLKELGGDNKHLAERLRTRETEAGDELRDAVERERNNALRERAAVEAERVRAVVAANAANADRDAARALVNGAIADRDAARALQAAAENARRAAEEARAADAKELEELRRFKATAQHAAHIKR